MEQCRRHPYGGLVVATLGALTVLMSGCGGGGSSPSTTTSTTPSWIPDLGPKRVSCKTVFDGCADLVDGSCLLEEGSDASVANYPQCSSLLKEVVDDFTSNAFSKHSEKEYILGALAGGLLRRATCLTAMRFLYLDSKSCPMPLPPDLDRLQVSGSSFNLFAIGDWGPTKPGMPIMGGKPQCTCANNNIALCRMSMHMHGKWGQSCNGRGQHQAEEYDDASQNVADQMAKLSQAQSPVAVINVGDNFYMGGIAGPWINITQTEKYLLGYSMVNTHSAFDETWGKVFMENQYDTNKKLHVPWLSILGNHDYGGQGCLADWQSQLEFTEVDKKNVWKMPFQYYKQRIVAEDWFVDIFMTDANIDDCCDPGGKSVCEQALCPDPAAKGDVEACKTRFKSWNDAGNAWLQEQLAISKKEGSRWQIVAGHYSDMNAAEEKWRLMNPPGQGGTSLYVGGHKHEQNIKQADKFGKPMVIITGGGGGYDLDTPSNGFGFATIKVSKDVLELQLIAEDGSPFGELHQIPHTTEQAYSRNASEPAREYVV